MKNPIRLFTLLTAMLLICSTVRADYLILVRAGIVRKSADRNSAIIQKVVKNDTLLLIATQQNDGYYYVQIPGTNKKGWIYRTFVRRYAGSLEIALGEAIGSHVPIAGVATDSVTVRVIDVGQGLCTIIRIPGNKYVIYDAGGGRNENGEDTYLQIQQLIPLGSSIELMVISHMDADHIVAASQVITGYKVKKLVYNGYDRKLAGDPNGETAVYKRMKTAIVSAHIPDLINLHERDSLIVPGNRFVIGDAVFKLLCGFPEPMSDWGLSSRPEKLNAVSIVMKLEYKGNSVLFTGDGVGRKKDMGDEACIATEKFLVDKAGDDLKSTVLIAAHHGAENGSSLPFLRKVAPSWIVISAGNDPVYLHPRADAARRMKQLVDSTHILRTDRGDDEGPKEWAYLRIPGCKDGRGDDDIQIALMNNGTYRVRYLDLRNVCTTH